MNPISGFTAPRSIFGSHPETLINPEQPAPAGFLLPPTPRFTRARYNPGAYRKRA
nr:MAG TPA: hypothetical protein [Caudoviricetes sp.]